MNRRILLLSLLLFPTAIWSSPNIRIAVLVDCNYEEISDQEYNVTKTHIFYNIDGTKDTEITTHHYVGAANDISEYICFDDFVTEPGCPENVMGKISNQHNGTTVYCITKPTPID